MSSMDGIPKVIIQQYSIIMSSLPKEIIKIIYSYLPQKYLARYSSVCKTWNESTRLPRFYRTIRLNNDKQLTNFIQMATTSKINSTLIGYFVCYLCLELPDSEAKCITITNLQALHKACPNLEWINNLNEENIKTGINKTLAFPCWEKLTHIDSWVTSFMLSWVIKQEQLQRKNQPSANQIVSLTLDVDLYKDYFMTEELKHRFSFYDDNINKNEHIYEGVDFHILHLKFTSIWQHLTDLKLAFDSNLDNEDESLNYYHVSTDHTFECIQQSCPLLESLSICHICLTLTNDYIISSHLVAPFTKLTSLSLIECVVIDSHIFDYFSKKYTHLSKLKCDFEITKKEAEFSILLQNMISNLLHLNHLSIVFF
ncbi:unnamed protein product [Cunninghamella blakesleeana]